MEASCLPFRFSRIRSSPIFFVLLSISILLCSYNVARAQISIGALTGAELNAIQTAVPFLTIAPDGRSSGMGDVGVASIPDAASQHWNAAKYAFLEKKGGVALSYTPWLTNQIPDIYQLYLAGYYKINPKNTISSSFRYFSLGQLNQMGSGIMMPPYYQYEFAVDAGYSRLFTDHFSSGIVLRYIHSDLLNGFSTLNGEDPPSGKSLAVDLGLYYQKDIQLGEKAGQWALGLDISNIGTPISYSDDAPKTPIPTNLRLGGRFSYDINNKHTLSIHADLNKLLVPSPPVYAEDSVTGELIVVRGKEDPSSVVLGMFQSFYDAPGLPRSDGTYSVAREEIYEIMFGLGAEYWYRQLFAIRTGYFHEHRTKGNREYFTFGAGARYRFLSFDLSYLLPVQGKSSPMYNTFRFALTAEFGRPGLLPDNISKKDAVSK